MTAGPTLRPIHSVLATLGAFSPAVSALLLTWRAEGRDGVRRLVDPVFRGSLKPGWYAFALLYVLSVKLLAALVVRLWTGAWPAFQIEALFLIPFAIAFSAPIQAGEEIGWRGYALPRLASRVGLRGASVVLGLLWAVWHLPLFFAPGVDTYQHSFWVYMLTVVGLSVAMAWLYARTGSLWIVMVMHAAVNNTKDIVPSATSAGQGVFGWSASPVSWATLGILSIAALALLARMPKRLAVEGSGSEPRPLT